jgi:hypothetical protein
MAVAAPLLLMAGTTVQAVGSMKQAAAAENAASFNRVTAMQNAELASQQAKEEERSYRILARKQLGDMRANYAASGISLDASAQDILEESAATAEMDALRIKHSGKLKSLGYSNEASLYKMQGDAAKQTGVFSATSALLGGGYKALDRGYF